MSWRFRKTFKVLPGVKLNVTRHGLSATLGAAPFSVNVGPRGVYRNISIPGTGLWDRQRLDIPSSQPFGIQPSPEDRAGVPTVPLRIPSTSSSTEIHSASTESLSSESMEQLRTLLKEAYDERDALTTEISATTLEANVAKSRYQDWKNGFLMKRIRKQSFAARKEAADTAVAKLEELQEQLRLTTLATEITIDRDQAEPYYRMRDDFATLSECQKIWNILTEQAIDRIVERSTANTAITRDPVSFSLDSCDLIQWEYKVPHLPNRTGGEMYIYPGFILYRASKQAFALIEFADVTLTLVSTHFTETGNVPSDTEIVGHTWAKSNKDGSPDRRFHDNYQVPLTHYGSLLFTSPDGLDVRYVCSNAALAERFAKAWAATRMSFSSQSVAEPSERFKAAKEKFGIAHETFGKHFTSDRGKSTIRKEDLTAYMAAGAELIEAAKEYVEKSNSSRSTKETFRRAAESAESARTHFEDCLCRGQTDMTDRFVAYAAALRAFFKATPS